MKRTNPVYFLTECIWVKLNRIADMAKAPSPIQMAITTKGIGATINGMAKENSLNFTNLAVGSAHSAWLHWPAPALLLRLAAGSGSLPVQ